VVRALDDVSVRVGRGEIFGLLGPNGAGKSTLVKIVTTVVHPDRAAGGILGRPLGDRAALARVGYLPESHRFPSYLTGKQLLCYYAALAKVPRDVRRKRADEMLWLVGMKDWTDTKISKYSKGMLQRLGIAQALMNDPELLFLDEPTDGLDPMGRRHVRLMLGELRERGKTVFINSHLLGELEMICDRVSILASGKVVRQGTLTELTEHSVEYRITVMGDLSGVAARVGELGGRVAGDTIVVAGHDSTKVNAVIDVLRSAGLMIESVVPRRVSLEDIFIEAVGHQEAAALGVTRTPPGKGARPATQVPHGSA
jgi:ABC-2 type transport system ATP-binding protein